MVQVIDEQTRKNVYDDLADLMIAAVEHNDLPVKEMKQSCQYILDTLDTIKTEDELLDFLRQLGAKWKSYAVEFVRYEGKKQEFADARKIQEIQNKLSNFLHA